MDEFDRISISRELSEIERVLSEIRMSKYTKLLLSYHILRIRNVLKLHG